MLNRPVHHWSLRIGASAGQGTNTSPATRLFLLFGVCVLPLIVIVARLGQLQSQLQPDYVAPYLQVRHETESIPAREGRILAADGSVLADDLASYDVLVHYRWLEEPVDPKWLTRKAWEQLSRAERRQPALVAAREQQILTRRRQIQAELATLCGHTHDEFITASREIQIRVEKIWSSVEQRLTARREQAAVNTAPDDVATPFWQHWWDRVQQELFQPPDRRRLEPLIIIEQEDYHLLWSGIPEAAATRILAHPERFPGIKTRLRTRRVYPHRDLAAHLLGARTPLREDERPEGDESLAGENPVRGRTGLERYYDHRLHGKPGRLVRTLNRHGEVLESRVETPPQHGQDLVLTLDLELQQRAEQMLDRALRQQSLDGDDASPAIPAQSAPPPGGCVVAIDVHTGALLAAAAAPRFDANLLISADSAQWNALAADPRKPFYPRLTHMALPPGSVFKALTSAALLQSGTLTPDDSIPCIGYLDRPDQHRCLIYRHYGIGHGDTRLADALCHSCNVYFFAGARRSGPEALVAWAEHFGFGSPTGIDLPGETGGNLPRPDNTAPQARRWYAGDTLGLAIGQSSLTVTPLQIARMMAAIANGGYLVTPHLATSGGPTRVDASADDVRPVFAHPEPQRISGLTAESLAAIQEGLYRVVHDPTGTGYKTVRLKDITIAGKTGTAEAGGGLPDHAWFAGYTPADQPRIAFAVVLEHGGSGSKAAGPIARELVQSLLDLGLVTPVTTLAGQSP